MSKHLWTAAATLGVLLAVGLAFVPAQPGKAKGEKYALIVGVQDYSGSGLSNLKYCENDAHALADLLADPKLGFAKKNILVLTQRATFDQKNKSLLPKAENIRAWLKTLKHYRPEDTLLVAFSGHGVHLKQFKEQGLFFCPEECDLNKSETLVSLSDIYEQLDKCPAGVKILVMDACRNDPSDGKGTEDRLESLTRPLVPDPKGGIAAFFSCRTGEKSFESDTLKHGIFTYYLLEGLKGAAADTDGDVTIPTLENYLTKKVPLAVIEDRKNPKIEQTPERRGKIVGSVVLSKTNGAAGNEITAKTLPSLKLMRIPARGKTFTMGSPKGEEGRYDSETEHEVTLSTDYYLGVTTVTRGQFAAFVRDDGYKTEAERDGKGGYGYNGDKFEQNPKFTWKNAGFKTIEQTDQHPVVQVSWNDAVAFCNWLSAKDGMDYRLPTEAQWEYACRAGTKTSYSFGDDPDKLGEYAWYIKNTNDTGTRAVATRKPNPFGLYDMHGNVYQWCSDWYAYPTGGVTDPQGPVTGAFRVHRGGGWGSPPQSCRSADRHRSHPLHRGADLGFRLAVTVR